MSIAKQYSKECNLLDSKRDISIDELKLDDSFDCYELFESINWSIYIL